MAAASADLSRELLGATKAMAADSDAATAKKANEALTGFDRLSAVDRVNAAAGLMPALREVFTALSIDAAETKATAVNERERNDKALAAMRQDLEQATTAIAPLHEELAATKDEKASLLGELSAARTKAERMEASLKESESQLLQANAELDHPAKPHPVNVATGTAVCRQELH